MEAVKFEQFDGQQEWNSLHSALILIISSFNIQNDAGKSAEFV